jgi:hypothetical protein
MNSKQIKLLPPNLRLGGSPLYHNQEAGVPPQADGVRRINEMCIELETYSNFNRSAAATYVGMSPLIIAAGLVVGFTTIGRDQLTFEIVISALASSISVPLIAILFYFLSGARRSRGAFVRIHRGTRKLYYILPGKERLHILDWDRLEVLAGYIPIVSAGGYASRHPLYLIGVDHALEPPAELCVACGNLGLFDGDRSARALWAYLQHFMAYGPDELPPPPPLSTRPSRKQATLQPYRDWFAGLRKALVTPRGMFWAPITVPLHLGWLLINAFPESVEQFLQFNVPYTSFPSEVDELCGFSDKRNPIARANGEVIDP